MNLKAHQRIIREIKSETIGIPSGIINDISIAVVKQVSIKTAKIIIEEYEWLGKLSAVNFYAYGIFFPDIYGNEHCGGVVVYGQEYIENLGKWDSYGYTGKIILLNRGACVHWAHPHSASKLIRTSMKMLPDKYKVVTAMVDHLAGEIGTIYQACGFDYIGSMCDNKPQSKTSINVWMANGKRYTFRGLRQIYGTTNLTELKKYLPDIVKIPQNTKHRYFAFRGTKKEQKELRKAIAEYIKPYPKRDGSETPLSFIISETKQPDKQTRLFN